MIINETIFKQLLQTNNADQKLSIYLPTHSASSSQTVNEDIIRFKNSLKAIRLDEDYDELELSETMEALEALIDDVEFWKHRTLGLAVFADAHGYEAVSLTPEVTQAHYIDERYVVSPLASMLSFGAGYFILEVNHTNPRLLHATTFSCEEINVPDMPDSFQSTVENVEYSKELQHQSGGTGTFHGHTDDAAIEDDERRYYKSIAHAVDVHLMHESQTEPLVMVGVEERVAGLRKQLKYAHVLADYTEGSSTSMNEQALHDHTYPLIDKLDDVRRQAIVDEYEKNDNTHVVAGVDDVKAAVAEHRVEKLLLEGFRRTTDSVRGGYDPVIVFQLDYYDDSIETLVREAIAQGAETVALSEGAFADKAPRAICRF